jgi:retinol-binding protein 3
MIGRIPAFKAFFARAHRLFSVVLVLTSLRLWAQETVSLTPRALETLADSLASQLTRYYVEKAPAAKMGSHIRKKCREGAYDNLRNDPHLLAAALTRDIQSVHRDEHFHVEYNPALAVEISGLVDDVPGMVAEKLKQEMNRNFGFRKAEVLNGNIGYLEISSFSRLNDYSRATADAALKLLSNTHALIIDLRYGVGGSPEMVTHLLSKFLSKRTHVTDIYIRAENATLPYYTRPDSTYSNLHQIPVYILASYKTFSAAEGFTYAMRQFRKAVVIGETTRGGAHTVTYRPLSSGFVADIPFGKALDPKTGANWEGTGIAPDIAAPAEQSLQLAESKIFEGFFASAKDSTETRRIRWQYRMLQAANNPFQPDSNSLKILAGDYGAYMISFDKGCLYYQKAGKAKFPLLPVSENCLRPKGNDSFIVEFSVQGGDSTIQVVTLYEDGRIERGTRER